MPYELQLAWAWWNATDILWRWTMAFCVLQVADFATTYIAIKMGGAEANPVVRWAIENLGLLPSLIGFKALSIAGVYYGAAKMGVDAVMIWTVFYVAVVIWNIAQINKLRGRK